MHEIRRKYAKGLALPGVLPYEVRLKFTTYLGHAKFPENSHRSPRTIFENTFCHLHVKQTLNLVLHRGIPVYYQTT